MGLLNKIIQKIKDPHLPPSNELATIIIDNIVDLDGFGAYLYDKIIPVYILGTRLFSINVVFKDDKLIMTITCTKSLIAIWGKNCQGTYDLGDPDLIAKMEEAIDYAR